MNTLLQLAELCSWCGRNFFPEDREFIDSMAKRCESTDTISISSEEHKKIDELYIKYR